ncbi:MAG: RNA polymerase subunit sigma-24 [Taibaiella sp.]|nr:RNA polymerase subunit sigma-24 [Taibaiella sp.]
MEQSQRNISKLVDHLFRHEAGKMVSVLTKIFGIENLQTAEDVVQDTLLHAFQVWTTDSIPDNPSGWLFRVAKNKAINIIKRNHHSISFDFSDKELLPLTSNYSFDATMDSFWKEELVKDDMLRMMYACCHPAISEENQVTLILKLLCGFSTAEIAKAFITNEDTISKRLYRTKEFFRNERIKLVIPSIAELKNRTEVVLNAIYLLFNEGYNSTHTEELIRIEVINEAMLLCKMLLANEYTQLPEVYALMALMCFHSSRTESRQTSEGTIVLLADQDRTKWNYQSITDGNTYMQLAASGNSISRYHIEAAIAYEHCIAKSFDATDWGKILSYYNLLCLHYSSPIAELNKAVVIMQVSGVEAAITALGNITDKNKMETFYLYHAIWGTLQIQAGNRIAAKGCFERAVELTQSVAEKNMLNEKIRMLV